MPFILAYPLLFAMYINRTVVPLQLQKEEVAEQYLKGKIARIKSKNCYH